MEKAHVVKTQRPLFLVVLCILTFVWSGFIVIGSFIAMALLNFIKSSGVGKEIYMINEILFGARKYSNEMREFFAFIEKVVEFGFAITLTNIILYGVVVFGTILMFRLKRIGFYVYILAQVLLVLVYPLFLGWNIIIVVEVLTSSFFMFLFIALYALNLKHLK